MANVIKSGLMADGSAWNLVKRWTEHKLPDGSIIEVAETGFLNTREKLEEGTTLPKTIKINLTGS